MVRILLGALKGGVVGAGIGYLASSGGVASGPLALLVYAVIGALVGVVCGRPFWRHETIFTPLLKALFGVGVGVGLYFLSRKLLGGLHVPIAAIPGSTDHPVSEVPAMIGTAVGALYGMFVELDDAGGKGKDAGSKGGGKPAAPAAPGPA
jgi:hypothetical protein